MKKLPIAVSSFVKIRSDDYLYVDKTAMVQQLFELGLIFNTHARNLVQMDW